MARKPCPMPQTSAGSALASRPLSRTVPKLDGSIAYSGSSSRRQIYLQNLPADQLSGGYCDIPFYLIFEMYSFFEGVGKVFQGSAKCAEESWFFLGLNIAEWSMIFFASMIVLLLLRYSLLIFKKGQK